MKAYTDVQQGDSIVITDRRATGNLLRNVGKIVPRDIPGKRLRKPAIYASTPDGRPDEYLGTMWKWSKINMPPYHMRNIA